MAPFLPTGGPLRADGGHGREQVWERRSILFYTLFKSPKLPGHLRRPGRAGVDCRRCKAGESSTGDAPSRGK